jgi:hypothetical protein
MSNLQMPRWSLDPPLGNTICTIMSSKLLKIKAWLPDVDSNHDSECPFVSVTYRFYIPTISKRSALSSFLYDFCTETYAGDDDFRGDQLLAVFRSGSSTLFKFDDMPANLPRGLNLNCIRGPQYMPFGPVRSAIERFTVRRAASHPLRGAH